MKRLKVIPFMLLPLALSSCGKNGFLGTYSFQLGRNSGTHFGVFATTTDKVYTYVDDEGTVITMPDSKVMNIRLNLGGTNVGGIVDLLNVDDVTIKTYYSIGKKLGGDLGNVLNFGFNIKEIIETIVPTEPDTPDESGLRRDGDTPSEGDEGEDPVISIPEDIYDITPEDTAKIVYSTISKSTIVFNIPVSMDDLIFQLYWYGLDLNDFEAELVEHAPGSHPLTKDEIDHINNDLHYPDTHDGKLFRDYHTLSLTLTKK